MTSRREVLGCEALTTSSGSPTRWERSDVSLRRHALGNRARRTSTKLTFVQHPDEDASPEAWIAGALSGDTVCGQHVANGYLSRWIAEHAMATTCSYCDREMEQPQAADAGRVGELMLEGIRREFGTLDDELVPWGMGYDGGRETLDVLVDLGVVGADDDPFITVVAGALAGVVWVQRDFFRSPAFDRMTMAWTAFVELVKHQSRYLFLLQPKGELGDPDELDPLETLSMVASTLEGAGLLATAPRGTRFFRARPHSEPEEFANAWELGAVPLNQADHAAANRFSAAGVPMFYGASSLSAALAEARSASAERPEVLTVGEFEAAQDLLLIDLTREVAVPDVLDEERGDRRPELRFLSSYRDEALRPVTRDGAEHIDYVPTQIVSEYFRSGFRTKAGQRVHGIRYPSVQSAGETNVVLFIGSDRVANPGGQREPVAEELRFLGPNEIRGPAQLILVDVERVKNG